MGSLKGRSHLQLRGPMVKPNNLQQVKQAMFNQHQYNPDIQAMFNKILVITEPLQLVIVQEPLNQAMGSHNLMVHRHLWLNRVLGSSNPSSHMVVVLMVVDIHSLRCILLTVLWLLDLSLSFQV